MAGSNKYSVGKKMKLGRVIEGNVDAIPESMIREGISEVGIFE